MTVVRKKPREDARLTDSNEDLRIPSGELFILGANFKTA